MSKNETRQTIQRDEVNPKPHIDSGYEGTTEDDFYIPPVGIEDVEISLHRLFNEDIGFTHKHIVGSNKNIHLKKPFVIFAVGERFALAKRLRPPRDRHNSLLLPAISIRRTSITQTGDDISGRGINQTTGTITIKRRLSKEDRDYQNLINKYMLKNMQNLPDSNRDDIDNVPIHDNALLDPKLGNNIWEIIKIPQPQFFTSTYEITFWTSYTQHMNYMIETFMSSFLPQSRIHKLVTDKGYWFIAYTEDSFNSADNFDDFKGEERLVRYTFTMTVKGYLLVPQGANNKIPIRKYVSAPRIVFDVQETSDEVHSEKNLNQQILQDENQFVLSDIEEDSDRSQRKTTNEKFKVKKEVIDPITGRKTIKYVSILESNEKKGETVYRASDVQTLEEFIKTVK